MSVRKSKSNHSRRSPSVVNIAAIIHDADDFISKIERQQKGWVYFEAELATVKMQEGKYFKVKIVADQDVVDGSSMSIDITGFEGRPITIDVSYGSGSEQWSKIDLRDLSEIKAKTRRWANILWEFSKICSFLKTFMLEHLEPVSKLNQKGGNHE